MGSGAGRIRDPFHEPGRAALSVRRALDDSTPAFSPLPILRAPAQADLRACRPGRRVRGVSHQADAERRLDRTDDRSAPESARWQCERRTIQGGRAQAHGQCEQPARQPKAPSGIAAQLGKAQQGHG
jgi:hypothetical protein